MHSFKHAATLQYTHPNNPYPLLLRVDKKSGHGAGKSVEKRYQFFLFRVLFQERFLINCLDFPSESKKLLINGALSRSLWGSFGSTSRIICKGSSKHFLPSTFLCFGFHVEGLIVGYPAYNGRGRVITTIFSYLISTVLLGNNDLIFRDAGPGVPLFDYSSHFSWAYEFSPETVSIVKQGDSTDFLFLWLGWSIRKPPWIPPLSGHEIAAAGISVLRTRFAFDLGTGALSDESATDGVSWTSRVVLTIGIFSDVESA